MRLAELCTRRVVNARRGETARTAAARMREEHVGDLVVIDRERRPIGSLTYNDLVEWSAEELDELVGMFGHGERREREAAPP